ncbi:MAG: hypothetical protein HN368_11695 [Spirochaetales bacterium]|jgi:hypothetical protein|nr:hypothetical protein [Spirochaetales bacterium]
MSIKQYLETSPIHDLTIYKSHINLEKEAVAFTGAPRKHPYDEEKLLLILDPFSSNTMFYEFNIENILHVDDMPNVTTEGGTTVNIVKIWIKRGALGMRYEPFEVSTPLRYFRDSETLQRAVSKSY